MHYIPRAWGTHVRFQREPSRSSAGSVVKVDLCGSGGVCRVHCVELRHQHLIILFTNIYSVFVYQHAFSVRYSTCSLQRSLLCLGSSRIFPFTPLSRGSHSKHHFQRNGLCVCIVFHLVHPRCVGLTCSKSIVPRCCQSSPTPSKEMIWEVIQEFPWRCPSFPRYFFSIVLLRTGA